MTVIRPNNQDNAVSADRNKTEITLRVTEAASNWLLGIGAKCLETEVPMAPGWVADLAAFWSPTMTEDANAKIITRSDYDALRALPPRITIAHEVKTGRSDFASEKKWKRERVADIQVLSFTTGIVQFGELPSGWWALEHHPVTGEVRSVVQRSAVGDVGVTQRLQVIANIAERRHNRTANQFFRDLQKKHLQEAGARRTISRVSECIGLVETIVRGEKSVEDAISWHLSHTVKVPDYIRQRLQKIHGLARRES